MTDALPVRARFATFELNLTTGELRHGEENTVLPEQSLRVLQLLLEREGDMVTREQIRKKLWPNDTIVEWDHSINAVVRNLRRVMGDLADQSRYIETLKRRGYRLMVPVEWLGSDESAREASPKADPKTVRVQPESGLIGKKVSHYRVLQIIGGGGMGMVYKAEDLKLGRRVALKFLPEELADDPAVLRRFRREARTASSLNHPNICTVYEIEEYEGQPFIVMELLEGETLRDRLASETKVITLDQLLDIALQTCDGLQAAHENAVIHRDIKPANIFLTTAGRAKILDFGLAKLMAGSDKGHPALADTQADIGLRPGAAALARTARTDDSHLTRMGLAMGTEGYMSPEQVLGEKLDARTDLFSFGLVLYEMASGRRALGGETAAVIKDAILYRTPVPLRELNSALPPGLVAIVDKALEKDRDRRYQSAAEVRRDLEAVKADTDPNKSERPAQWWKSMFRR